ncbi:SHOCT domain-containing protein [Enterococcus hirae]|nr:SHOCT domain-containing protein [Enterococcus hirae]
MGLFDKLKKAGSDMMKDGEICGKVKKGEPLTEEEFAFFSEKHPDTTIEEMKKEWDDKQTLMRHAEHKIGGLKFFTDENGYYYFTARKELTGERYYLVNFDWSGPQYDTKSSTSTTGKDKKQGRAGSTVAGGILGSMLVPGVGTVIGAAAGANRKKKTDINRKSETTTTQEERNTTAYLIFVEKDNKSVLTKTITCNNQIASQVRQLTFTLESVALEKEEPIVESSEQPSLTPADEIRKFKQLMEEGIITQEEFDAKKKDLLGL